MIAQAVLTILLLNVAFTVGQTQESAECRPPHPPGRDAGCCNTPAFFKLDSTFHDMMHQCHDKVGMKRGHHGNGGGPPSPPDFSVHEVSFTSECADECVFQGLKLMGSDGELDKDAIKKFITETHTGEWAEIGATTIDSCLASAKNEANSSGCKTGARNVLKCFTRNIFLNCPKPQWTESDDCTAAKERLTKCPDAMPPPMKRPQ